MYIPIILLLATRNASKAPLTVVGDGSLLWRVLFKGMSKEATNEEVPTPIWRSVHPSSLGIVPPWTQPRLEAWYEPISQPLTGNPQIPSFGSIATGGEFFLFLMNR